MMMMMMMMMMIIIIIIIIIFNLLVSLIFCPQFFVQFAKYDFINQETTNIATKGTTEGQLPKETLCPWNVFR